VVQAKFKVRSLESIGTLDRDNDVGVVRVSAALMRRIGERNTLVRISILHRGEKKSVVRIMRAATGTRALLKDEVALQYDDRRTLGIKQAGTAHELEISPVNEWLALPAFLLGHPSPLVKREAAFGLALMFVGAVLGFLVGLPIG